MTVYNSYDRQISNPNQFYALEILRRDNKIVYFSVILRNRKKRMLFKRIVFLHVLPEELNSRNSPLFYSFPKILLLCDILMLKIRDLTNIKVYRIVFLSNWQKRSNFHMKFIRRTVKGIQIYFLLYLSIIQQSET